MFTHRHLLRHVPTVKRSVPYAQFLQTTTLRQPYLPKPAYKWSGKELKAYNIEITFQDAPTFFGETPLPPPGVEQDVISAHTYKDAVNPTTRTTLNHLSLLDASKVLKSSTIGFTVHLFRCLRYAHGSHNSRLWRGRNRLEFFIAGTRKWTQVDVSLINQDFANDTVLLVQGDEENPGRDPQAQLIAKAIAAFQNDNFLRLAQGNETWDSRIFAGIIMTRSSPCFFKIPVTQELAQCVKDGQYPPTPTIVTGHFPEIPCPEVRVSEGMHHLDNRYVMLQCYEAFKKFF